MARAIEARWRLAPEEFPAGRQRAVDAANRAIALDPASGLAFVPLSLLAPTAAYAEREALLQKALEVAPWEPEILKHASDFEFAVGRMREGYRLIARAHETDPFNRVIANNFAMALGDIGFLRESEDAFAAARARWPEFDWPVSTPLVRSALLGDWKAAQPLLEAARASTDENMRMSLTAVALLQDKPEEARAKLRKLAERQLEATGSVELRVIFYTYAVGFPEDAFEILHRASFDHLRATDGRGADTIFLPGLIFSVVNAPMRRDPRFVDLCAKLGLCEYWTETDSWPDCVEEVAPYYNFKARAREFAGRSGHGA
jgi:tetratricopeptide (TPR) repeat protein